MAALSLAACGATSATKGAAVSPSNPALIHTASIQVAGKTETVLKNAKGRTLYYLTADTGTTVVCHRRMRQQLAAAPLPFEYPDPRSGAAGQPDRRELPQRQPGG
jgi:predicted lipoprotein with Yx(FWY)xxD motif